MRKGVNNSWEYYENQCFIGTTLWSKITRPEYEINDIYCIPNFDYMKCNRLNMLNVDFLDDALEKNDNCIIITHHMPSYDLIHPKYITPKIAPYNQWFCCNLNDLIREKSGKIDAWIYGHTHTPSYKKYMIFLLHVTQLVTQMKTNLYRLIMLLSLI